METTSRWQTIDHVLDFGPEQTIRIWETPPKADTPNRYTTILVAAGFARRMDHFTGLVEYLSENGFRVIRYDSLNHVGLSTGNIDEFTMTAGKRSLLAVYAWLQGRGIDKIGLVAASLAARVAYEVIADIDLAFLVTAVGVVNLRDTLEKALGFDYLSLPLEDLPDALDFEGHRLGSEVFVRDCFQFDWHSLNSTIDKMSDFKSPFIAFTANNDDWVRQEEVMAFMTSIDNEQCKVYSLLGSSHDLSENLVVLRNFLQSVTKAAIALDNRQLDISLDIIEPQFEQITLAKVNERRLMRDIETQQAEMTQQAATS
ncbi:MAG: acyl transferase [Gammaproteobacteria bacterium]|nr:acyl transferase [Gammaproteobacteria bacterium]